MKYEKPWMSEKEINLIVKYLDKDDIMMEWGSGGSTNYFPQFVEKYYSIEHDKTWFDEIKNDIPSNVNYNFVGLDSNLTDPTQKDQIKSYLDFVDTFNVEKFDKVLIDGRGRGWCASKILPYLKEDSIVFIHDYWLRSQYHIVERWYDVVDSVKEGQSLVVLKPKKQFITQNKQTNIEISFILPSRNNLKYLKWAYNAIRKNQGTHTVEICIADDFSNDGTWEWCQETMSNDLLFKAIRNEGPTRLGHTILYDRLINDVATKDIAMIYHADMYLCPGALDAIGKHISPKTIVSLTRIEPPLHPPGPEKIFVEWGATEPEDFNEETFLAWFSKLDKKEPTEGIFAPWAFYRKDFQEIGGHDPLFAPQSKEDSDIFNRFQLNGVKFIQTWEGFVYHMTCRGSRFNPTLTTPGTNSNEWEAQNIRSTKNFLRKWGSSIKHTPLMDPIVSPKYNIGFVVENCSLPLLEVLEPWCDRIYVNEVFKVIGRAWDYVEMEQSNTKFDLSKRVLTIEHNDPIGENDIVIEFDGTKLTQESFNLIQQLPDIIQNSGEIGTFELDIFKITINSLETYEHTLIYL